MSYQIEHSNLKKLRLVKLFNKLPTSANEVSDYTNGFLSSDEEHGRKRTLEEIETVLNTARQTFAKGKFVITLSDACCHYSRYDTFINLATGDIDYLEAFKVAFDYAAILYMKAVKDTSIVDGATFAILHRRSQLMNFEPEEDVNDFDEILRAMLVEIDGTEGKINKPMSHIIGRHDYLLYLLMPRLDSRITTNHRALYAALVNGDVATFESILDAA